MENLKVVALVSGGKDSCYSAMKCVAHGHELVALANLYPEDAEKQRDSYMYQTQGFEMLEQIAQCMGLPLERQPIKGESLNQDLNYQLGDKQDEVESMYSLLKAIKEKYPQVNAVCSGAVLSNYQRTRVENVCERLGLISLAFLWNKDQRELLDEMINANVDAVLVKVCSMGLDQSHLGKTIKNLRDDFVKLENKFGFHVCGEGGEYESITLDCPLFKKGRIILDETKIRVLEARPDAPICVLDVIGSHIEWKERDDVVKRADERQITSPKPLDTPVLSGSPSVKISRGKSCSSQVLGPFSSEIPEKAFSELKASIGSNFDKLCYVHLLVSDMSQFGKINELFQAIFLPGMQPPARATVEVRMDGRCCISVTAIMAEKWRSVLQVKSRSEWAPQCIGPYSQATLLDDNLILIAGQIPLDPVTMQLSFSSLREAFCLCVKNSFNVSMDRTLNGSQALSAIVYVSFRRNTELLSPLHDEVASMLQELSTQHSRELSWLFEAKLVILFVPRLPKDAPIEVEVVSAKINSQCRATISPNLSSTPSWVRSFFSCSGSLKPINGAIGIPVDAVAIWDTVNENLNRVEQVDLSISLPRDDDDDV